MNCHLCNKQLTEDTFDTYNIGGITLRDHSCKNHLCESRKTFYTVRIGLIKPDYVIKNYTLIYKQCDKYVFVVGNRSITYLYKIIPESYSIGI